MSETVLEHELGSDTEPHDHGADSHVHEPDFSPQPVPMGISAGVVTMNDGSDRVLVTYSSLNGTWSVFYDREGAIAHAQTLLGLAYQPPATVESG